jgi:hypothetical protein
VIHLIVSIGLLERRLLERSDACSHMLYDSPHSIPAAEVECEPAILHRHLYRPVTSTTD